MGFMHVGDTKHQAFAPEALLPFIITLLKESFIIATKFEYVESLFRLEPLKKALNCYTSCLFFSRINTEFLGLTFLLFKCCGNLFRVHAAPDDRL